MEFNAKQTLEISFWQVTGKTGWFDSNSCILTDVEGVIKL
jgi:hypothetical protein